MSDKEKHITKKLLKSIDLDSPSIDFTDKVMAKVNTIPDEVILKDTILTSLLKKNSLETPNSDFSIEIMAKVSTNSIADYKPIISKKSWNIIFLFFASFIIYVLLSKPITIQNDSYISKLSMISNSLITDFGNSLTQNIQIPSILVVSILCLSVLLLLDTVLRTKKIF
ncbi:MAG: hypothetical protein L3J20_06135 [Flavobacteriaceae bacterium]|nr:hypothetical protein [Flavobacteriaceae bacterium]